MKLYVPFALTTSVAPDGLLELGNGVPYVVPTGTSSLVFKLPVTATFLSVTFTSGLPKLSTSK